MYPLQHKISVGSHPASKAWRWTLGLLLASVALSASAQQDPPSRVARIAVEQGTVSFSPAGDDSWYDAVPNRPLTTGDRLWTDRDSRAEVQVGSAALRLDERTLLEISELGDNQLRLTVQQGSAQLRVQADGIGDKIELDTGNLALVVQSAGEYRIDANPANDVTQVAVDAGNATVFGENNQQRSLASRQQFAATGRDLAAAAAGPSGSNAFERFVAERNRIEDQSVAARYVSREMVGYQQLDRYGDWQNDATYGAVWYPRDVAADWAPYSEGRWIEQKPWGWTWVDSAPWAFAPMHYGRWARFGPRWGWVPGPRHAQPVYAPALVAFAGGESAQARLSIGGGRQGVGWFPLAPGERWQPGYRASQRYIDQVNRNADLRRREQQRGAAEREAYAYRRSPDALTVVPVDVFGHGAIGPRQTVRLPAAAFGAPGIGPAPGVFWSPQAGSAPIGAPWQRAAALPPADARGRGEWRGGRDRFDGREGREGREGRRGREDRGQPPIGQTLPLPLGSAAGRQQQQILLQQQAAAQQALRQQALQQQQAAQQQQIRQQQDQQRRQSAQQQQRDVDEQQALQQRLQLRAAQNQMQQTARLQELQQQQQQQQQIQAQQQALQAQQRQQAAQQQAAHQQAAQTQQAARRQQEAALLQQRQQAQTMQQQQLAAQQLQQAQQQRAAAAQQMQQRGGQSQGAPAPATRRPQRDSLGRLTFEPDKP